MLQKIKTMIFSDKMHFKTPLKLIKISCLVTLCCIALTTKANQPNQLNHLFVKSQTKAIEINYEYFKTQQTTNQFNYLIDLGDYGNYELQLNPNDLFAPDFKEQLQQKKSLPLTFSGKIVNQPESHIALTVNKNFMSGYVFNGKNTIYFEPLRNLSEQAKANELIIYNEKDALNEKLHCAHNHDQAMSFKVAEQQQLFSKREGCDEYSVELVLAADYGMFQQYGSETEVRNLITSILNAARQNYNDEFNDPITFQVVDEYIAASAADDLWDVNETNARSLLDEFAESNFTDKIYDLASLWVTREIWEIRDGERRTLAGLAFNGGICRTNQKYNLISVLNSTQDYLVTVISHEVGHNFSAGHDPEGTEFIMSEGELSSTWSTTSLNSINNFYPNTNCLCSTEFVDLNIVGFCSQFGGEGNITKAPKIENLGTIASGVTKVSLFLSEDSNVTTDDYFATSINFDVLQPGQSRNATISLNFDEVNLPGGDYYAGIIVDSENNIEEGDETNNVGCISIIAIEGVQPKPDLVVDNCSSVSITGNTINTGNFSIKNSGNATSTNALLGVYLSANTIIDDNDYFIAQTTIVTLAAGGSMTRALERNISTINPPIPAGTYYIGFLADRNNTLIESNENNNTCYDSSPLFTVTYDCKNTTAHNYNPSATYGDETSCETCSDGVKNGNEEDEDCGGSCPNNCVPQGADLTIENCSSVAITNNLINTGSFSVKNVGNATAASTLLGVYLSSNTIIDDNDHLIIQSTFAALAAGGSLSRTLSRNISEVNPPIPAGTYYVGFLVDKNNTLTELNENNNTCYDSSSRFTVTYGCKDATAHNYNPSATYGDESLCETCSDGVKNGDEEDEDCGGSCPNNCIPQGADLTIENCSSVVITNNTINTGSFSVKNVGTATAASTLLGVYLSANTIIDDNDHLIIQSSFAALAAGGSLSRTLARNISEVSPPIPAGSYYIGFLADKNNTLTELNENNNTCYDTSSRFTVTYGCKDATAHNYNPNATYGDETSCETCSDGVKNGNEEDIDCGASCPNNCIPQGADLTIENCSSVAITNNTINTGSFSVKNAGNATAASTFLGVYLSANTIIDDNDHLIIQSSFATLAAGGSLSRTLARNISEVNPPVPAGTYYVGFLVDKNNTLTELNENNNTCYDTSPRFTVTYGCKDATAHNYNPNATYEDETSCETCTDGVKNGDETDIDCGGSCTENCTDGNPPGCQQSDREALIALYNSTDGANWTNPWNLNESIENWQGITLNNNGCVESVYFFNNNLNGSLPQEIGKLSELKRLQLRYNGISGELPSSIGELSKLETLNLSINDLTGIIPTSLGSLINLKYISLSDNQLSGLIPNQLASLSKLESFHLYNNELSGNIPSELGSLTSLKFLSLNGNSLTGFIPNTLGNLVKLEKLWLMSNQLNGAIPSSLGNLSNLKELKLYSNQLNGYIPWQLSNLSSLEEISLSHNLLSGPIPLQLGCLSNLEELSLSNNQLTGTIPAEIGDLNNLTFFGVTVNNLSGCLDRHLKNICDANSYVNSGNNFEMEWDSFCANGVQAICQPNACLSNDANTLLNLSFDNTLEGVNGERPLNYKGLSYDDRAYQNRALNILSNYFDDEMVLTYPAANNINLNQGTIEAWVMHFWDGDDPAQHTLVQYGVAGGLLFFKDGANNFRLILNRWSPAGFPEIGVGTSTQFWESGEWKHVAATWGNGEIILYVNGEIADRNTYTQPITTIGDTEFNIGSAAGNATWGGLIDQFRISNKVRTKEEINLFRFACAGSDRIKSSTPIEASNYPNPFKHNTIIEFDLPNEKPVTLFVTDMMGKQVEKLLNNELLLKGNHTVTFDGSDYPNGIYYYTIQAGDFTKTQKMILMR